jgi:hypothetical protein
LEILNCVSVWCDLSAVAKGRRGKPEAQYVREALRVSGEKAEVLRVYLIQLLYMLMETVHKRALVVESQFSTLSKELSEKYSDALTSAELLGFSAPSWSFSRTFSSRPCGGKGISASTGPRTISPRTSRGPSRLPRWLPGRVFPSPASAAASRKPSAWVSRTTCFNCDATTPKGSWKPSAFPSAGSPRTAVSSRPAISSSSSSAGQGRPPRPTASKRADSIEVVARTGTHRGNGNKHKMDNLT